MKDLNNSQIDMITYRKYEDNEDSENKPILSVHDKNNTYKDILNRKIRDSCNIEYIYKNSHNEIGIKNEIKTINDEFWQLKMKYFSAIESNNSIQLLDITYELNLNFWEFEDNNGNNGLILACFLDFENIVKVLLSILKQKLNQNDFTIFLNNRNDKGLSALHWASYRGNINIIKLLTDEKADHKIQDDNGLNVMHFAAQGNKINALFFFNYHYNLSYETVDNMNYTVFHWAVYSESYKVIEFLISQKVNINLQDNDGSTPLHIAVIKQNVRIVTKLLRNNSDKHIYDNNNNLPIDIAMNIHENDKNNPNLSHYSSYIYNSEEIVEVLKDQWFNNIFSNKKSLLLAIMFILILVFIEMFFNMFIYIGKKLFY